MSPRIAYLDVLAAHAEQTPAAPALRDERGSLTWAQLWAAATDAAGWLAGLGVRPGQRVAIALPASAANLLVLVGAMRLGAVAAPVNVLLRGRDMADYLARIEPALVVAGRAQAAVIAAAAAGPPVVELDVHTTPPGAPGWLPTTPRGPLADTADLDPQAPTIMFGTGGTTGLPKAAMWSQEALWLYGASCALAMETRRTDVELFFSPMFHIALVTGPFGTLFAGGALHVLSGFDADAVTEVLAAGEITRLFGAPTALNRIITNPAFDPAAMGAVRRVLFGSTRSEPDLPARLRVAFPNAEFITGYGATEFGAVIRLRSWELRDGVDPGVGKPVPGVRVLIVGDDGAVLPPGRVGELVIRAPWQMSGYWSGSRPAAAESPFLHGGVRSGDIGERDADGWIYLRGRTKDVVITGGENVFPFEVEDALSSHPSVAEAAVVGMLDPEWGERVEAAVVPSGSPPPDPAELLAYLRERIAAYKVPKRIHIVDRLPLTAAMKIDKRALRSRLADD